jgi:hypothetical protein
MTSRKKIVWYFRTSDLTGVVGHVHTCMHRRHEIQSANMRRLPLVRYTSGHEENSAGATRTPTYERSCPTVDVSKMGDIGGPGTRLYVLKSLCTSFPWDFCVGSHKFDASCTRGRCQSALFPIPLTLCWKGQQLSLTSTWRAASCSPLLLTSAARTPLINSRSSSYSLDHSSSYVLDLSPTVLLPASSR